MGADMSLRTVYLRAATPFDLEAATAMAATLTSQATDDDLEHLAGQFDLDHGPHATLAQRRDAALTLLTGLLTSFAESLSSRDVTSGPFGAEGAHVDEYATGGMSSSDGPTEAYDEWDFLFDTEKLPGRWADYLGAAGGLLHPNGDGPVVTTVAMRAWSQLPAA